MEAPKISIVTCSYNPNIEHLSRCLDSVQQQSYTNIEHIFNDAYSNHETLDAIHNYTEKNQSRYKIIFFQTKPAGIANALNTAMQHVGGDVTHFLHADDYYMKTTTLSDVANYFIENPHVDWVAGNLALEYGKRMIRLPLSKVIHLNSEKLLYFSHENTFVRTSAILRHGGFNEKMKTSVEFRLWLRLIQESKPLFVDDYFTGFIVHKNSQSTGSLRNFLVGVQEYLTSYRDENIIVGLGKKDQSRIYNAFKQASDVLRGKAKRAE